MPAVDKASGQIRNVGKAVCSQQFFPSSPMQCSRHSALIFGTMGLTLSNVSFFPCAFRKSGGINGSSKLNLHVLLSRLCLWQRPWLLVFLNKNSCHSVFQRDYWMCLPAFWLLRSLLKVKIYLASVRVLFSQ